MAKTDLRARVYRAADELFIERGSLYGFGYREVRGRAKASSNEMGPLLDDWRASRLDILRSRPDALAAIAEEFAGRIWLMAKLLSPEISVDLKLDPTGSVPPKLSANRSVLKSGKAAIPAQGVSSGSDLNRKTASELLTAIPRPERAAKILPPSRKRAAVVQKLRMKEAGQRVFVLRPPRPSPQPTILSSGDWEGARDEEVAREVARLLREKSDRMRASEIHRMLPKHARIGTFDHAQRDLKSALSGSRMEWFPGGWFWFRNEQRHPAKRDRRDTEEADRRREGNALWWRIAHTIAALGRPFTQTEIEDACAKELKAFKGTWLRLRLMRARDRDPPFLKIVSPGIMRWTGLDPAMVVAED